MKEYAWRAYERETVPWVRIPPSPYMIHRRDSKPANADQWEEERRMSGSERAGSEALGGKGRAEEESHPLRID